MTSFTQRNGELVFVIRRPIVRMPFVEDDGGAALAGYKSKCNTGDCVCRAVAIAAQLPYEQVLASLQAGKDKQRRSRYEMARGLKASDRKPARHGVRTKHKWFNDYLEGLGFQWVPTAQIGVPCYTHLRAGELPQGRLIVNVSRHLTAVIDGVIHDLGNPDRGGTRYVYGYWQKVGP